MGRAIRTAPGQAVLLLVVLAVAVLSVVGIALKVTTDAERVAAGQEWLVGRAFFAADAGIRWASVRLRATSSFLSRPEFADPPNPFGTVSFPFPAHRHGPGGAFTGDPDEDGVRVLVQWPSYLGRRLRAGSGLYDYVFEVRARGSENTTVPRYSFDLVADVDIGPLPADFDPAGAAPPSDIIRSVISNWKEP